MPISRLLLRSNPACTLASSSEDDSDLSSPERDRPRIIHIPASKNDRKSADRRSTIPDNERRAADRSREGHHIALVSPHSSHPERTSKRPPKSRVAGTCPTDPVDATAKPTFIRRVTSKLNICIPSRSGTQSSQSTRTLPGDPGPVQGPRSHTPAVAVSPTLPNSFVSKQHREAALRERGLLPPRKDLSEQEREADKRLACVPSPVSVTFDGATEAERFKTNWLATNSESSDSECAPPSLQSARPSVPPFDAGVARRSGEGKADPPPAGRPSFCSSVPPLSPSSPLEVLHEEPSEYGPVTPPPLPSPVKPPIIISGPSSSPPSPIRVESLVSCTISSNCPGSTLDSQSQSSHPPPVPEKENVRLRASRRLTSDSCDRPRKVARLARLGTHSLTSLRRSVAESLKAPSTSTVSSRSLSSSSSCAQAPRTAIDPTMHSIGSILREIKDINDDESRRLSELAFLD